MATLFSQRPGSSTILPTFPAVPSAFATERARNTRLSLGYSWPLDRVNVLGGNRAEGHTGCVNALSWARNGELLLSGGDDTTVRIWKLDPSDAAQEYPFTSRCVIRTGHTANIFSAQMLPHSWRVATAAGDNEARVFDVQSTLSTMTSLDKEVTLSSRQSCIRVIRCHKERVKRVITEDSPDLFLTVAEDGTVRQHDLRTPHNCGSSSCTAPLVELDQELCTLSLSPLTPYQLVVAGDGPYAYLFDRRHSRRTLEASWGGVPRAGQDLTTCVRRFGRTVKAPPSEPFRRDHITSVRMSQSNGHELLVSYSSDAVYLFSTTDEPDIEDNMSRTSTSSGSHKEQRASPERKIPNVVGLSGPEDDEETMDELNEEEDEEDLDGVMQWDEVGDHPDVPVVTPRTRFAGARNVATVKDVNFLGPSDEWVTSGSDDGNFFIWNKSSGAVHGIYEGDGSVVNMVEGHPTLPLVAVSGIDYTVKLFAPARGQSVSFSRIDDMERIVEANRSQRRRARMVDLESLAALLGASPLDTDSNVGLTVEPGCANQ